MNTHQATLKILRRKTWNYNHPVFYSRKSPALSSLPDDLAESLHNHLEVVRDV